MAVVTAPLLSFGAAGQIGKTMVYASWKGRPYVRQLVTPANPQTPAQVSTRTAFTFLSDVWKLSPADFRAPWTAYAKNLVMTDRNAWIKLNASNLRDGPDTIGIILSPGAAGGLAVPITATGGTASIILDIAPPDPLPAGWSIVQAIGAALADQDPANPTDLRVYTVSADTAPWDITITGIPAGDYQATAWFVYQRSASLTDLAYGPGPTQPVTVT